MLTIRMGSNLYRPLTQVRNLRDAAHALPELQRACDTAHAVRGRAFSFTDRVHVVKGARHPRRRQAPHATPGDLRDSAYASSATTPARGECRIIAGCCCGVEGTRSLSPGGGCSSPACPTWISGAPLQPLESTVSTSAERHAGGRTASATCHYGLTHDCGDAVITCPIR